MRKVPRNSSIKNETSKKARKEVTVNKFLSSLKMKKGPESEFNETMLLLYLCSDPLTLNVTESHQTLTILGIV